MSETPILGPTLLVRRGDTVQQVPLAGDSLTVGRAAGSDLVIKDMSVARRHARFDRAPDGTWVVSDMESSGGTYVNGLQSRRHVLGSGDRIRIGSTEIEFRPEPLSCPLGAEAARERVRRLLAAGPDAGSIPPTDYTEEHFYHGDEEFRSGESLPPGAVRPAEHAIYEREAEFFDLAAAAEGPPNRWETPEWRISLALPCAWPPGWGTHVAYYAHTTPPDGQGGRCFARIAFDAARPDDWRVDRLAGHIALVKSEPPKYEFPEGCRVMPDVFSDGVGDDIEKHALWERRVAVEATVFDLARGVEVDPWRRAWVRALYAWRFSSGVVTAELRALHPRFFAWFEDPTFELPT